MLQTLCFVLSAIAAFWIIVMNSRISRRESTSEMVQTTFGDEKAHYDKFSDMMRELDEARKSVTDYAVLTSDNRDGRDILMRQLNRYELICLGIRQHVFDEQFYKLWFFSQVMKDYDRLRPLIEAIRREQNNHAYFCEFESLVAKWRRKRHPVKYPSVWKIIWWIVTNQRAKARNALRVR